MTGTVSGAARAVRVTKERYGEDFYRMAGHKGGMVSRGGGFAHNHALAVLAGKKGGKLSKRGKGSVTKDRIEPARDKILHLLNAGCSISEISRELDFPEGSLRKWVKKNTEWK